MKKLIFSFISAIVLLFQFPAEVVSETNTCVPEFKFKEGWFGGDGAYSVPFSKDVSIWLFGDTFTGKQENISRSKTKLVSNTIGISSCSEKGWNIKYFWNNVGTEKSEAFFFRKDKPYRYWPVHGFFEKGKLYVALEQVVNTGEENTFGFKVTGVDIAIISNPLDNPEKWKINYENLYSGTTFIPGISFVKYGNYYYTYAFIDDEKHKKYHPIVLSRISSDKLINFKSNLEYLTDKNKWKKGLFLNDAKIIIEKGSSEMSISYNNILKKWIAVYTKTEFLSNEIVMRTSDKPEGKWSEPVSIYKVPEMLSENEEYDKDTFCYAAKAHEEYSFHDRMVITYACNSFNFSKLLNNSGIYIPKTILVKPGW